MLSSDDEDDGASSSEDLTVCVWSSPGLDDRLRADRGALADNDVAEDGGARSESHAVPDLGVSVACGGRARW